MTRTDLTNTYIPITTACLCVAALLSGAYTWAHDRSELHGNTEMAKENRARIKILENQMTEQTTVLRLQLETMRDIKKKLDGSP